MAIYRLKSSIVSRSKGQSAVACAAYRSGEKLYDERYDELHDYTKKQDVVHQEIALPENAPKWMGDRETLWNNVEATEKRKDSQLAREVQLALPRELTLEQNIQLTREFVKDRFVAAGMVADIAIHNPKASDGEMQPHAHVLLTMRGIKGDGFGLKERTWNDKCELEMWRAEWCDYQNKHLALHGHDIQVDHRSLKDQGIDLIPQRKIGATGFFERMAAYADHLMDTQENGERLIANPSIVLDVLTRQQSTFTHRDIARVVNRYTANGEQFTLVYEKVKALPELVNLGQDDKHIERLTTHGMIKLETEMAMGANQLMAHSNHEVDASAIEPMAKSHQLSAQQTVALEHIVTGNNLRNVIGYAGTGKSRLLGAARELWENAGYKVSGAALSGIAAENLEASSGIKSSTLASKLYRWEKGTESLTDKDILIIDEAGMLASRQMAIVVGEAAKHGAKVILTGDVEQIQAIEAGAPFRLLTEKAGYAELTEVRRQQAAWQQAATIQLATGQTADALGQYKAHDCLYHFETQAEAKAAILDSWNDARLSQPDKTQLMMAYTRVDVADLNQMAREMRQSLGELGSDYMVSTVKGEKAFAENDRIYFLLKNDGLGVKNGTLGTILKMKESLSGTDMVVKLDKEKEGNPVTIQFNTADYRHLDHGYAATIHKGQGVTVDRGYLLTSAYMDRHTTYVGMTRHRESVELFSSKEVFPNYDEMVKALGRERLKENTMDYLGNAFEKASFAAYRGMDTLWDTFWEKHGSQWLDKMQTVVSNLADGAKTVIQTVRDQAGKQFGVSKDDLAWLQETKAWVEKTFGKNEPKQAGQMQSTETPGSTNKEMSLEERYQKILREHDGHVGKSPDIDKNINKSSDQEMDF